MKPVSALYVKGSVRGYVIFLGLAPMAHFPGSISGRPWALGFGREEWSKVGREGVRSWFCRIRLEDHAHLRHWMRWDRSANLPERGKINLAWMGRFYVPEGRQGKKHISSIFLTNPRGILRC